MKKSRLFISAIIIALFIFFPKVMFIITAIVAVIAFLTVRSVKKMINNLW